MEYTYKTIRAIEFLNNYQQKDIEKNVKEYKEFLNALVEIQQFIADSKVKFPNWKLAIDTMITKSLLHCNSFVNLISGIDLDLEHFKDKNHKIIDIPSAYVLLRAQLENFLMIDFIYFQPQNEDESKFRFNCWDYSSIKSVYKYKSYSSSKMIDFLNENESKLHELWAEIKESRYYKMLSKDKRKRLEKRGDSRLGNSWDDMIKLSNLNPLLFGNLYSLLSKHAHSESIGIFQLKGLKLGFHNNHEQAYLILLLSKSLICLLILRLKEYIKTAEIKYNSLNSKIQKDIEVHSMFIDKELLNKTST